MTKVEDGTVDRLGVYFDGQTRSTSLVSASINLCSSFSTLVSPWWVQVRFPFIYSCTGDDTRAHTLTPAIFVTQKRTKKTSARARESEREREEIKVVTRGWNFQLVLAILHLLFNLALFKEHARRQFILISRPTGYIPFLPLMFPFNGQLNFYFDPGSGPLRLPTQSS